MRKEYVPAIVLYVISAIIFVISLLCLIFDRLSWATWLVLGVAVMLFASSRLVKIGAALRREEEDGEAN